MAPVARGKIPQAPRDGQAFAAAMADSLPTFAELEEREPIEVNSAQMRKWLCDCLDAPLTNIPLAQIWPATR